MKKITFTLLLSLRLAFTANSFSSDDDNKNLLIGKWMLTKLTKSGENIDFSGTLEYYTFTDSELIGSRISFAKSLSNRISYKYENNLIIIIENDNPLTAIKVKSLTDKLLILAVLDDEGNEVGDEAEYVRQLTLYSEFAINSISNDDDDKSLLVGKWLLARITKSGENIDLGGASMYYTFTSNRYIPSGTDTWGNNLSDATSGNYTYKNDVIILTVNGVDELLILDVKSLTDRLLVVVFREYMEMEFTRQ